MRKRIINFRRFEITHREILADIIFFVSCFLISLLALYIFDIHWSFYPGNTIFPPSKHVGISSELFLIGGFIGAFIGLIIIKLILVGVKEEEKVWKNKNS